MSNYRRANGNGNCYFFTLVSYRRQPILCDDEIRNALRQSILKVRQKYPFQINAWVLLPDHLHCIWTLPEDDYNFSMRWSLIKRNVSFNCSSQYENNQWLTSSKRKRRECTIWQRRFWEHQIRDSKDYDRHMDYIHYNPVKHGLCNNPIDWPYSTLQKLIAEGRYPKGWASDLSPKIDGEFGE
jgi:putative transposase